MKTIRYVLSIILLAGAVQAVSAQFTAENRLIVDFAWYPANLEGYKITGYSPLDYSTVPAEDFPLPGDESRDLGGQAFEGQVKFVHSLRMPWMSGTGPLTSGNSLEVQLRGEISPVSVNTVVRTVLTPLAVLKLDAAFSLGTGWTLVGLNGLALNTVDEPFDPTPLGGVVLKGEFGVTGQFDLGVVVPGDWTHVALVYRAGMEYDLNTSAEEDEPWQWLVDSGENLNGWSWTQTALVGYMTPAMPLLDTAGLLLETTQRITNYDLSPLDDGGWGSDFMEMNLGPVFVLTWGAGNSMTIQLQFAMERDYTDATIGFEHFTKRGGDTANPTYWYFRRVALSYSRSF